MNIYSLYKKTHNITGLSYLGFTKQDPFAYKGSGTYWQSHIKKHGYDVTTKILFQTTSKDEIKEKGLYYSNLWKIVESSDWANLREENGYGGKTSTSFKKNTIPHNKGKKCSYISESKKKYWENWKISHPDYKSKWKINNREPTSPERLAAKNEGSSIRMIEKNNQKNECPHCGVRTNIGNLKRWHLDNCKKKIKSFSM